MNSLSDKMLNELLSSQHNIFPFLCLLFPLFIFLAGGNTKLLESFPGKPLVKKYIVAFVALLIGLLILFCGQYHFGGFDLSAPIDTGWRVMQGQQTYIDFMTTFPPAFNLGSIVGFKLFGLKYFSLVQMASLYAILTFICSYLLLKQITNNFPISLIISVYLQAVTSILCSYLWYNPMTEISGVIYLLSAVVLLHRPVSLLSQTSYLASLILIAGMKANIAGVLVLGTTIVFLTTTLRWRVLILSGISLIIFTIFYQINGMPLNLILASIFEASERAASIKGLFQRGLGLAEVIFMILCIAAILIPFMIALLQKTEKALASRTFCICAVGVLAAMYGEWTNGESRLMDMPLMLVAALLGIIEIYDPVGVFKTSFSNTKKIVSYYLAIAIFLTLIGVVFSLDRYRVEKIGYGSFYEQQIAEHEVPLPFFKGIHVGPRLLEVVNEIRNVLDNNKGGKVYFGPRMQWAYASFGMPSPLNQPVIWDPGTVFAKRNEFKYVQNWIAHEFEILIFLKNDFTYMSPEFLAAIAARYSVDQSYPQLTVLHKNK